MANPDLADGAGPPAPRWRPHLVAALCSGGYAASAATAGLVRAHYSPVCWGKGPQSGLAEAVTAVLATTGLVLLALCWLASVRLRARTRSRTAVTVTVGSLAVIAGLAAAATAWPPYC